MTKNELKELKKQIERIELVFDENYRVFIEDQSISEKERKQLLYIQKRLNEAKTAYNAKVKEFKDRNFLEKIIDTKIDTTVEDIKKVGNTLKNINEIVVSAAMTESVAKEVLKSETVNSIKKLFSSDEQKLKTNKKNRTITIDSSEDAVRHYYKGKGKTVELGSTTKEAIKKSKDMLRYIRKITTGITDNPAKGSGLSVDLTLEGKKTFHIGRTLMAYQTVCNNNTCTTTFKVAENDGFWDPIGDNDGKGPGGELPGGTPYKYKPFSWDVTFNNPGYNVDENNRPVLMLLPPK